MGSCWKAGRTKNLRPFNLGCFFTFKVNLPSILFSTLLHCQYYPLFYLNFFLHGICLQKFIVFMFCILYFMFQEAPKPNLNPSWLKNHDVRIFVYLHTFYCDIYLLFVNCLWSFLNGGKKGLIATFNHLWIVTDMVLVIQHSQLWSQFSLLSYFQTKYQFLIFIKIF